MADGDTESAPLSIGTVSDATGIPPATLRTWERRYGFPDPCRTDAGHRRYAPSVVERLRLINRALDSGCRPSDVVDLSTSELETIVESSDHEESSEQEDAGSDDRGHAAGAGVEVGPEAGTADDQEWLDEWMDAVRRLDGVRLRAYLRSSWNELGGIDFLERRVAPFLVHIGHEWRAGNLEIVHEHHVSEQLQDFLSARWRPLAERASGPVAVCATLPGEDHAIGLHIAAVVMAMANWRVVFLGPRTPPEEMVDAAEMHDGRGVVVSFSANFEPESARRALSSIRDRAAESIEVVAGGAGAPPEDYTPTGVRNFDTLEAFYQWAFEEASPSDRTSQ